MKVSASRSFGQRQTAEQPETDAQPDVPPMRAYAPLAYSEEPLPVEDERRRYRRVKVRLAGRFMRENTLEYPCYTNDVSAGGISFTAPVICSAGEFIVAYVEEIGRIEGMVSRTYDNGFALVLKASQHKREKIIATLTWLLNRHELDKVDSRRYERMVPSNPGSLLLLADGTEIETQILDLSLGGARIAPVDKVRTGDTIRLGRSRGRVVRVDETGIGIQFDNEQSINSVDHHFS